MGVRAYTVPIYLHGITPVRLDERYRFEDQASPLTSVTLEGSRLLARYAIKASTTDQTPPEDLLILCVDDQDPVGDSGRLLNWTYVDTFELHGRLHHIWWHLAPRRAA